MHTFEYNKPEKLNVKRMMEVLDTFELIQHATIFTHKLGITTDLIIIK